MQGEIFLQEANGAYHGSVLEILTGWTGLGGVSKSSSFLGDPPPDPRFLASLGELSLVELDHCSVLEIPTGWTGTGSVSKSSSFEIFRKYLPEMYEAYATNIARIDLDYDDDVNEAVSDLQCVGYLKYPVEVRVKLQSLTETNRW
jgi:hypothetical protein